jgi:hypothetical protein
MSLSWSWNYSECYRFRVLKRDKIAALFELMTCVKGGLWNWTVRYLVHKNLPLVLVLRIRSSELWLRVDW